VTQTGSIKWYGQRAKAQAHRGAARGLFLWAEHVLGCSRPLVPIEEATLERSGVASVDEARLRAAVSYDTPYAVRQHEELSWRHDQGRQAKYLEQPLNQEKPVGLQIVRREVAKELKP
jgi:hypothetical protein